MNARHETTKIITDWKTNQFTDSLTSNDLWPHLTAIDFQKCYLHRLWQAQPTCHLQGLWNLMNYFFTLFPFFSMNYLCRLNTQHVFIFWKSQLQHTDTSFSAFLSIVPFIQGHSATDTWTPFITSVPHPQLCAEDNQGLMTHPMAFAM